MQCPRCGSDKVLHCTDATKYPNERYYECFDCGYQSRRVKLRQHRCLNHKSEQEIDLEELEKEWE
jgi:predicted Zn-ribbon and HTH transcriptional regulator